MSQIYVTDIESDKQAPFTHLSLGHATTPHQDKSFPTFAPLRVPHFAVLEISLLHSRLYDHMQDLVNSHPLTATVSFHHMWLQLAATYGKVIHFGLVQPTQFYATNIRGCNNGAFTKAHPVN
jgi:hypothetical protein